jgi:hypothetical protein
MKPPARWRYISTSRTDSEKGRGWFHFAVQILRLSPKPDAGTVDEEVGGRFSRAMVFC